MAESSATGHAAADLRPLHGQQGQQHGRQHGRQQGQQQGQQHGREQGQPLRALDAAAARRWAVVTRAALAARRAEIDALNVFPVPDADTGTNLYLSFDAALDAARVEYEERARAGRPLDDTDLAAEADLFARALLLKARGNSGVILSQIFRGFADEAARSAGPSFGAAGLAAALSRADRLAWASVTRPVEGTILSVSRAASAAATEAAGHTEDLYAVSTAALDAARVALARTPAQLPRLAQAGVVDAGGAGYVLLLESLQRVVVGDTASDSPGGEDPLRRRAGWTLPAALEVPGPDLEPGGPAYEVMYLLDQCTEEAVETLKHRLDALGDSLLVVGGGDLYNVHVHVDDVGAAIEAGIAAGRPHRIKVTHFEEQGGPAPTRAARAVVAGAAGDGLAEVFRSAGAWPVPTGPRRRPSAGQLLDAARATGAGSVVLLPNDADTLLAADAAASVAAQEGIDLRVVPTRTPLEGIAALAVYDPHGSRDDNVLAMSSAAAATRDGAVTVATAVAQTQAGACRPGDVLGLVGGEVVVVGDDLAEVAEQVADRLLSGGGELLTLLSGAGAPPALADAVAARVRARRPDVDVTRLNGGQPVYQLLIGVE